MHPESEKLITVNKGYDHRVAHRAIAKIELRQGWEPEATRAQLLRIVDGLTSS